MSIKDLRTGCVSQEDTDILRPLLCGVRCALAPLGFGELQELLQTAPAREPTLLPQSIDTSRGFMLKFPILTPFGVESAAKMTDIFTSSHFSLYFTQSGKAQVHFCHSGAWKGCPSPLGSACTRTAQTRWGSLNKYLFQRTEEL